MEVISYDITKMLPSPGCSISIAERKKCSGEEKKRSQSIKQYRNFSGTGYFLAFDESVLDQLLFPQCDEMLMKSCFPRGASVSSLLTTFLSLLLAEQMLPTAPLLALVQSQTMQSSVSYRLFIVVSKVRWAFLTRSALGESTEVM